MGIVPLEQAMAQAQELGLDLVEVAPEASPPVCRIQDYKKFLYEQRKRIKDSRKKQRHVDIKGVRMRIRIDPHDFQTKVKRIIHFLQQGHKCKLTMQFFGREMEHRNRGREIINKVTEQIKEWGAPESPVMSVGRFFNIILAPNKETLKKLQHQQKDKGREKEHSDGKQDTSKDNADASAPDAETQESVAQGASAQHASAQDTGAQDMSAQNEELKEREVEENAKTEDKSSGGQAIQDDGLGENQA